MSIYVLDAETDPFAHGRVIRPFAMCLYNDETIKVVWSSDCAKIMVQQIKRLPACTIYAHNGGKFDFHFLLPYANKTDIKIINGRIAVMWIGKARLVDSWLLIPMALGAYKKETIDYDKFLEDRREQHKKEIVKYLVSDCKNLYDLIIGFQKVVGKKLTIGQAAFTKLRQIGIDIPKLTESHDVTFRPFYFGGRCEAIKKGTTTGKLSYLDINSAYPWAMTFDHPTGSQYSITNKLPSVAGPWFAKIVATNRRALCVRDKNGLTFDCEYGTFFATGWEIVAALELGLIQIEKVLQVYHPARTVNFSEYVHETKALRDAAKKAGNEIEQIAYKFLMNSAYGKYATDPRDWQNYYLDDIGSEPDMGYEWLTDVGNLSIYQTPTYDGEGFYDVATAASITGKVRAYLLETMANCQDIIYCDTDSIVCKGYANTIKIGKNLGEWKLEDTGSKMCIAGKKLYAFFGENSVKIASKGVRLTASEIERISNGEEIEHLKETPTFSIKKGQSYVKRKIKRT